MPENGEQKKQADTAAVAAASETIIAEPMPPPVLPPATKTPAQFNTQINIQQLPPKALEKLSPEQLFELSKTAFAQFERSDERQFKLAMDQVTTSSTSQRWGMCVGGVISLCGFGAVTYLAAEGHQVVAAIIGTFLATVIAVAIGSRLNQ